MVDAENGNDENTGHGVNKVSHQQNKTIYISAKLLNAIKHKFSHISNDKETGIENYRAVRGVSKRRWRGLPGARGQVNVNVNVNLLPGKSMSRSMSIFCQVSQCRGQVDNQAQGQIRLLA